MSRIDEVFEYEDADRKDKTYYVGDDFAYETLSKEAQRVKMQLQQRGRKGREQGNKSGRKKSVKVTLATIGETR